jgi:hypothetical protein
MPPRADLNRLAAMPGLLALPLALFLAGCGTSHPGQYARSAPVAERGGHHQHDPRQAAVEDEEAEPVDPDINKPVPSPYRWNGSTQRVVEGSGKAGETTASAGTAAGGQFRGKSVTVEPGDTLATMARRHGVSVAALKQINGLSSDRLQAGQSLVIPTATR